MQQQPTTDTVVIIVVEHCSPSGDIFDYHIVASKLSGREWCKCGTNLLNAVSICLVVDF